MTRQYRQFCGLASALDLLGDRWTLLILRQLWSGPQRFGELETGLVDVPSNLLASRLRNLASHGLIDVDVPADDRRGRLYVVPPEVRDSLRDVLTALTRFGIAHMPDDATDEVSFHTDWLLLPLQAAHRPGVLARPLVVSFRSGDSQAQFVIDATDVVPTTSGNPDITFEGRHDALLASLRDPAGMPGLIARGQLDVAGTKEDLEALGRTLVPISPARSDRADGRIASPTSRPATRS